MGLFSVECVTENQQYRTRTVRMSNVRVDTGSELTWISQESLKKSRHRNGETGQALRHGQRGDYYPVVRVGGAVTTDEVMFGEACDLQLLGARTLEGLSLRVDSRNRKLVAAGPLIAAGTVESGDHQ